MGLTNKQVDDEAAYYEQKFVRDPQWSAREPNSDESARWAAIEPLLRSSVPPASGGGRGRILDVGCGRGWLTALASKYGTAMGIEPVAEVVEHARRLFPGIRFESLSPDDYASRPGFEPADVVLCSEVIEHVPSPHQAQFVRQLRALTRPGGCLILTTPRGEMFARWSWLRSLLPLRYRGLPDQPTEELLPEAAVRALLVRGGFRVEAQARAYVRYRALSPANAVLGVRTIEAMLERPGFRALRSFCHWRWAVYQVWRARAEP